MSGDEAMRAKLARSVTKWKRFYEVKELIISTIFHIKRKPFLMVTFATAF
jgi:hypothetical protein